MTQENNKYLFLSDLDGTLLNDVKQITPKTLEALKSFVSRGNTFAICTGRDITSATKVYEELGLNVLRGCYIVSFNGGLIFDVDAKEIIHRDGLDFDIVEDVFDIARDMGIHVQTYNDKFILIEEFSESMAFYRKVIKTPLIIARNLMDFLDGIAYKILAIELEDHDKMERFREVVLEKYGDRIDTFYSSEFYLELIPKGSGKGSALQMLRKILDVREDHTIAAGDADNDLSMLEAAGISIGMSNGEPSVKKVASMVTETDNNNDGLAPILDSFV